MPIGYQNVCAIAVMGFLKEEKFQKILKRWKAKSMRIPCIFPIEEFADKYSAEELSKYELTMSMLNNSTLFIRLVFGISPA